MLVLGVDPVVVVEDAVAADVVEAGGGVHGIEIGEVLLAQHEVGTAGAEHLLPEVRERGCGSSGVDVHLFLRFVAAGG